MVAETRIVIEPAYPIQGVQLGQVIIVGCGGTGGYVVRDLARTLSGLPTKVDLVLIDGDLVESKNLKRQNFISPDIGKNKAVVLANRYSTLTPQIACLPKYLETAAELKDMLLSKTTNGASNRLIISCVDNVKTRLLIRDAYLNPGLPGGAVVYWIDLGNDENTGQAAVGVNPISWDYINGPVSGIYPVPDIFDMYPEFAQRQDKLPTELSCAEMAESSPQYGHINGVAAMIAINWAHELLVLGKIKSHSVEFSTYNRFSHKPLNETTLYNWMEFFAPIRASTWIKKQYEARRAKQVGSVVISAVVEEPTPVKTNRKSRGKKTETVEVDVRERLLEALKRIPATPAN